VSAQLKSFEGPDVQLVLDRIRAELGPGAKINGAEKIRVGGLFGFFAKEHYRVVVEEPEGAGNGAPAGAGIPGTSETVNGRSSRRARRKAASLTSKTVPAQVSPVPEPTATLPDRQIDVFSAMADATNDVNDVGAIPAVASSPVIESPAAQAPMAETPVIETPVSAAMAPAPEADPVTESFDAVLTRVATTLDVTPPATANGNGSTTGHSTGNGLAYPPETDTSVPDDMVVPDDATGPEVAAYDHLAADDDMVVHDNSPGYDDVAAPVGIATKAAQFLNEMTPAPVADVPDDSLAGALRRVGLEPALVAWVADGLRAGGGLETLLVEALATLLPAPAVPARPGSLLVVVGAGAPARRLGAALADEIGIDPARVPLASLDPGAYALATGPLLVRSAEDAAERAPGWRRSEAAVVVVEAAVTNGERSWATHLIAALRPTAVWGVVDSTSKTEDVAAWAEALGGLDALALENTDATVSPAAALGVGIAVARLNGQPATAARWAATIVDRVRPCR
jgi:hypothetical protein